MLKGDSKSCPFFMSVIEGGINLIASNMLADFFYAKEARLKIKQAVGHATESGWCGTSLYRYLNGFLLEFLM